MRSLALKVIFAITALSLMTVSANAQKPVSAKSATRSSFAGTYQGVLKPTPAISLTLIFHVAGTDTDPTATIDVPEQNAVGMAVTKTTVIDTAVVFAIDSVGATFTGKRSADGKTIVGTFTQAGQNLPLTLTRNDSPAILARPQLPKPPFPYHTEDVSYLNPKTAGVTLAGTLSLPQGTGPFPVVLFITGSGPQDRDETVFGHKPFAVIADYLARRGIASLRVDDRGVAKSTGDSSHCTSADFADDTRAGIAYLKTRKEIDPKQLGLIGHSEGGLIAPMVAANNPDVAFIVLLAGTGVTGDAIIVEQRAAIDKATGVTPVVAAQNKAILAKLLAVVKNTTDSTQVGTALQSAVDTEVAKLSAKEQQTIKAQLVPIVAMFASPWIGYFVRCDPAPVLQSLSCPVLALNGSLDLQVLPKQNLPPIEAALKKANNKDVTIRELPNLNHLFQHTKTGSPMEYATNTETFAPEALAILGDWIAAHTKPAKP